MSWFSELFTKPAPFADHELKSVGVVLSEANMRAMEIMISMGEHEVAMNALREQSRFQAASGLLTIIQKTFDTYAERLDLIATLPDDAPKN